jgi:chromosome segregation ATPase
VNTLLIIEEGRRNNVQRKPRLLYYFAYWIIGILCCGCSSGPSYKDDTDYREIERNSDRNSAALAITGAELAAGVERIDDQAFRMRSELDTLETAIERSGLAEAEKGALLHQVSVAQAEAAALTGQVASTRVVVEQLNAQLARQREINAELSAEHDHREATAAAISGELADTKEKLAKVSGQRNLTMVIAAALALAIIGYIAFRVLRFLWIIPV